MKVYIINQAFDYCGEKHEHYTEHKCYLNKEQALEKFNVMKKELHEFMEDYHPDAEFTESNEEMYYEIECQDDWRSISVQELEAE